MERLKHAKKSVGLKQTLEAVRTNQATLVYLAQDADQKVVEEITGLCRQNDIPIEYIETMKQLGKACGIDVGASMACLLKISD